VEGKLSNAGVKTNYYKLVKSPGIRDIYSSLAKRQNTRAPPARCDILTMPARKDILQACPNTRDSAFPCTVQSGL